MVSPHPTSPNGNKTTKKTWSVIDIVLAVWCSATWGGGGGGALASDRRAGERSPHAFVHSASASRMSTGGDFSCTAGTDQRAARLYTAL